ncbi:MAG: hypothetical protein P4L26_14665 [Terracidiphilus sp.]|nr:hypothetical protein [Terracidiphilus sp.]
MLPECRHILPSGHKCTALALRGKYYCYFHTRLHALAAKPAPAPDEPLKLPVLEDRSAILVALSQIFNALGDSRLKPRRAGLYLYGLQIATQNVERQHDVIPMMASHDVTRSPEGDELGPIISRCEPPGDCPGCDIRTVCEEYNAISEQELEDDEEDDE